MTQRRPRGVGVVVVTHGQLATELVNAAEMIVGDLPQFTAVSIGWHDDVNDAREAIAAGHREGAIEGGGVLLTDMFGGTPSNLGMTFLEAGPRRSDHRRQPADADQAGEGARRRDLRALAREMCEHGRAAIRVASDLLRGEPGTAGEGVTAGCVRAVTVVNQLGMHARAAAKFVHLAGRSFAAGSSVTRGSRTVDGKSILGLLLLAAARGTTI